jgi:hypothetical protein
MRNRSPHAEHDVYSGSGSAGLSRLQHQPSTGTLDRNTGYLTTLFQNEVGGEVESFDGSGIVVLRSANPHAVLGSSMLSSSI